MEERIAVPGGTVGARMLGGGTPGVPMLFLHGGPGGSCAGFGVFESLAEARPIVMFDQLGSASSTWDGDDLWRVDRFCAEVDAVRAAFDLDEVVLFGHSWGGWLAIDYLCRGASGVRGAVLADTSAGFPSFADSIARRVATMDADQRVAIESAPRSGDVDGAGPTYRAAAIEFYRRFVVRNVPGDIAETVIDRQGSSEVFGAMQGADELHADGSLAAWDRVDDLHLIDCPVLVIAGRFDHMDEHCAREISDGIVDADLVIFEDSSHCVHLEEPDAALAAVRRWLDGHRL